MAVTNAYEQARTMTRVVEGSKRPVIRAASYAQNATDIEYDSARKARGVAAMFDPKLKRSKSASAWWNPI